MHGIVQAHKAAARKCHTEWFWVVDADNIVEPDFDFSFVWEGQYPPNNAVSVWKARNSGNGLSYGYGGVKLLPRQRVLDIADDVVDFTTSLSDNFFPFPEIASTTVTDATAYDAWKNGFRECAKLSSGIIHRSDDEFNTSVLNHWCNTAVGRYADYMIQGALEGKEFGEKNRDNPIELKRLNDFHWLKQRYAGRNPNTAAYPILSGLTDWYSDNEFFPSLRDAVMEYPDANWADALSTGQIASKKWLIDKLNYVFELYYETDACFEHVYICASWYGILGQMLLDDLILHDIQHVYGMDIDPSAVQVANRLMSHWSEGLRFQTTLKDIRDLQFDKDRLVFNIDGNDEDIFVTPSLIINTSCEHMEPDDFNRWYSRIPKGVLVVLQSNDFFDHHEHVNCMKDLDDFRSNTPMNSYYTGEQSMGKYTRFMRIGVK